MENFALIDIIEQYCIDNNIVFLYGDEFYQNIGASDDDYEEDQLVLIADFDFQTLITEAGAISEISYPGIIGIGRKFETPTETNPGEASLDEDVIQKYKRRLKDLTTLLHSAIITIACSNELTITNLNGRFDINKFDTNIDFVVADLTFVQ